LVKEFFSFHCYEGDHLTGNGLSLHTVMPVRACRLPLYSFVKNRRFPAGIEICAVRRLGL